MFLEDKVFAPEVQGGNEAQVHISVQITIGNQSNAESRRIMRDFGKPDFSVIIDITRLGENEVLRV